MKKLWEGCVVALLLISVAHANNDADLLNSFNDVAKDLPAAKPIASTPVKSAAAAKPLNVKSSAEYQQLQQQLAAAQQQISTLQASNKQLENNLAGQKNNGTDLAALNALKDKNQVQNKELNLLREQLAAAQQKSEQQVKQQREQIQLQDKQIAQLQEAAKKKAAISSQPEVKIAEKKPQGDTERDSYTLGQFFASNSEPMMKILAAAKVNLQPHWLAAGFASRIQQQASLIPDGEMANRYGEMQQSMQKGMETLVGQSQQKITQQIGKRPLLKKEQGVSWLAIKKANAELVANQTVAVQVKVTTLDGKVINDFSDQAVPFNQSVPPLMFEGMALSGKGGEIEGWALAKDIANREPLPAWVAPYDVVHYQLALQ